MAILECIPTVTTQIQMYGEPHTLFIIFSPIPFSSELETVITLRCSFVHSPSLCIFSHVYIQNRKIQFALSLARCYKWNSTICIAFQFCFFLVNKISEIFSNLDHTDSAHYFQLLPSVHSKQTCKENHD